MLNVFISDLGRYNAGELNGEWYDMETEEGREKAAQAVADIEKIGSGEYFISDYESDWTDISASAGGLDEIAEVMERLEQLDELDKEYYKAISSMETFDKEEIFYILDNCSYDIVHVHENDKLMSDDPYTLLAHEFVDNGLITLCDLGERYFNYEMFGRDLQHDYMDVADVEDGYIFVRVDY